MSARKRKRDISDDVAWGSAEGTGINQCDQRINAGEPELRAGEVSCRSAHSARYAMER